MKTITPHYNYCTTLRSSRITDTQNAALLAPFSYDEFTEAIKQMHLDKSPGPDGFNPGFYLSFWKHNGKDISLTCRGVTEPSIRQARYGSVLKE